MNKVGYVYDAIMSLHRDPDDHDHPECPDRIQEIYKTLLNQGLVSRMIAVKSREITWEELLQAHGVEYLTNLYRDLSGDSSQLRWVSQLYNSIYVNSDTLMCAKVAAGSTLEIATEVAQGRLSSGVAIVRPPGHHASRHQASGFCLFNNVSVAAKNLVSQGYKVLIVDWDIHAPSPDIVSNDPNIRLVSIQRYDHGTFYPGKQDDDLGFNIFFGNLNGYIDDQVYLTKLNELLPLALHEFQPHIILVSAGFDAIEGDPLGCSHLTTKGYQEMTQILKNTCSKVVLVLEGGYNLKKISQAFADCVKVLLV